MKKRVFISYLWTTALIACLLVIYMFYQLGH